MLAMQPVRRTAAAQRQSLSRRKEQPALRVGIAVAGDLLRDSVRSCLQDSLVLEPYSARSVRDVTHLIQNQQIHALILDDQFDPHTWIGHLVSRFKQDAADQGLDLAILLVGSFADGALIYELF